MAKRANRKLRAALEAYEAPPIEESVDEALLEYIKERKASFPDANH